MSWKNLLKRKKPKYFDAKQVLSMWNIYDQLGSLTAPYLFLVLIGILGLIAYSTGQFHNEYIQLSDILKTIHYGGCGFLVMFLIVFLEYVTGLYDFLTRWIYKTEYKKYYGKSPTL